MKQYLKVLLTLILIAAEIAIFFFVPVFSIEIASSPHAGSAHKTMFQLINLREEVLFEEPLIVLRSSYTWLAAFPCLLIIAALIWGMLAKGRIGRTWTAVAVVMISAGITVFLDDFGGGCSVFHASFSDDGYSAHIGSDWAFYHFGYCVLISVYICFENFYRPKRQAKSAP